MIKWLQDNPTGLVLGSVCGGLLLILLLLLVFSALPLTTDSDADVEGAGTEAIELPQLAESPPIDTYFVITERPLFNESRQPPLELDMDVDPLAGIDEDENQDAPDVELSGIIITPSLKMATLKRRDNSESLIAFEGRAIEGEFSSWHVSEIGERQVTLTSGGGKELQLELQVHDVAIAEPTRAPPPARQTAESDKSEEADLEQGDAEPMTRAEEIRQRIAERREELRRQAEEEDQAGTESAPANYQDAIRSMMSRNRKSTPDDDNEDQQ